jgi:hypothetical protein
MTVKQLLLGNSSVDTFPWQHAVVAFEVSHIYDYIKKLCRQQAEVIQNHENANVRDIRKGEA